MSRESPNYLVNMWHFFLHVFLCFLSLWQIEIQDEVAAEISTVDDAVEFIAKTI